MKRDASKVIWRTVVFAGAMLGAPACTKNKTQSTTPSNTAQTKPADANGSGTANTAAQTPADPNAGNSGDGNPCGAAPDPRPRGTDDETGGSMGRGFVLS